MKCAAHRRLLVAKLRHDGCGCRQSGMANFDDYKARIIDKSKTRVTAFLNIVGHGMGGGEFEQNLADMEVKPTADMALKPFRQTLGVDRE